MVMYFMPNSTQARITLRKFSVPARWPARRGRPRLAAHRPFPSMMKATWVGSLVIGSSESFVFDFRLRQGLNLHDFLFFMVSDRIHVLDIFISQLLQFFFSFLKIVFGNHFFFLEFPQILD